MKLKQKQRKSSLSKFRKIPRRTLMSCTWLFVLLILSGNTFGTENSSLFDQEKKITGKVTDSSGSPLPGVSILVKGTTKGTITDADGKYTLLNINDDAILQISFIGMQSQEIKVGGKINFDFTMLEETIGLEEVISIGYQTKVKGELTGSVANISGETIKNSSSGNTLKSLQGRLPGVIINDRGGDVGLDSRMDIFIRGKSTWGDNSPLLIVDGIPREINDLKFISQDDVESISVLKDASAAIYGASAANGVIVMTTKRGKAGIKPTIQVNSSYGITYFARVVEMMSSYQYATIDNEVAERIGSSKVFTQNDLDLFQSGENPITHPSTNWFKESLKSIAPQQRQNLTLTGGSEAIQYFVGGEYLDQSSHFRTDEFGSKRYNLRSNLDAKVSDFLKLGADLSFRLEDEFMPRDRNNINSRIGRSIPINAAYFPNGLPAYGAELGLNPALMAKDVAGFEDTESFSFRSKFSFDLDLNFLAKGLSLDGYFAYDRNNYKRKELKIPFTVYQYVDGEYNEAIGNGGSSNTELWDRRSEWANQLYHVKLKYVNSFGDHHLNTFLAYEQAERQSSNMGGYRKNIFSTSLPELSLGIQDGREIWGSSGETGKVNYFGSLSYSYKGKYLFDCTLRRDGSFNFPENKRFGVFPGISVGWNITEEPFFLKGNAIDNLKLRASWATMGNDKIDQFQYLTTYGLADASYYIFGENRTYYAGLREERFPNPNITWETSKTYNIGFDLSMFKKKFNLEFDYFRANRTDILRQRSAAIPNFAALSLPDENMGEVENKGVELSLGYGNNIGDFHYNIGGQFTYNRNKVIYLAEAKGVLDWQKLEGHPIDSWLVYKLVGNGVVNTQEELENYPHRSGTKLGDLHVLDYNKDGVINENDMVRDYSSPRPDIQFSFNTDLEYKGFELRLLWQGQARAKTMLRFTDTGNQPAYSFERRWTPENPNSNHPAAYNQANANYNLLSEYHLHNAAFLRLKSAEVAYNFSNVSILPNLFKSLRLYVNATNLWTLVSGDMKYYDPEITDSFARYYPQLSSCTVGLNITL